MKKVIIILGIIIFTLLFAPQFSHDPIDTYNLNAEFNQQDNIEYVSFSLKNNTIGLLFNVKYTITVYDSEEIALGKKTISYAKIMLPKQTETISDTITLPEDAAPAQIKVHTEITRLRH